MEAPKLIAIGGLLVCSAVFGAFAASLFNIRRSYSRPITPKENLSIRALQSPEDDEGSDEDDGTETSRIRDWNFDDGPFKLVLVVNTDLKMGKGKMAAQCCHATLGCYRRARKRAYNAVKGWEYLGQTKICVKCPDEAIMWDVKEKAEAAGLTTYMVMDAGRTQIASGSRTVLGIGPAPESAFLGITDDLKLM